MQKGKIILLVMVIILLPLVAGEVYRTSTDVDLKQQCFNNGTFCSSSAECNFTIMKPNGVIVIDNLPATNQISFHNYTINHNQTNISGVWTYTVVCTDGNNQNFNEFEFTINPPGIDFSQQRTDAFSRSIYVIIILGVLLMISAFFVKNVTALRWSLFIISGIFFLITINLVLVGLRDEVVNENVIGLFDTIVASSFYIYWGAGLFIFVLWFLTVLMTLKSIADNKRQEGIIGING